MANVVGIEAEIRLRAGKGAARATRRAGKVPAVVYGGHQEPTLLALDPRVVVRELHRGGWQSRLYEISAGAGTIRALIRGVQFHPVSDAPEHVDFQRLVPGERIKVSVPVHFDNDIMSPGLKRGGVLNVVRHELELICSPNNIPTLIEIDVKDANIGHSIHISHVALPEGVTPAITSRDFTIATIAGRGKDEEDAKPAEAAATTAAAPAAKAAPAKK